MFDGAIELPYTYSGNGRMAYSSWLGMGFLLLSVSCLAKDMSMKQGGAENAPIRRIPKAGGGGGEAVAQRLRQGAARNPGNVKRAGQTLQQGNSRMSQNAGKQPSLEQRVGVGAGSRRGALPQRVQQPVRSAAEMAESYIGYRPQCLADVASHCSNVQRENNFQVLFCLQRQPADVSQECHQVSLCSSHPRLQTALTGMAVVL